MARALHGTIVVVKHLHRSQVLRQVGPTCPHCCLKPGAGSEANAHAVHHNGEAGHLPLLESALHGSHRGLGRQYRVARQCQAEVVRRLYKDHDDCDRHVREAAQHCGAAHQRVDASVRKGVANGAAAHSLPQQPTSEGADKHGWQEVAHRNWQASHAGCQSSVHCQGHCQGAGVRSVRIAREEVFHGALGALEQQRRDLVHVALLARVPHKLQALRRQPTWHGVAGLALRVPGLRDATHCHGHECESQGAEHGIEHALSDPRVGLPRMPSSHSRLAKPPYSDKHTREHGAEDAQAGS
mmetsp:Transcript_64939/g.209131  ORF Transcript_64939/g.209131 Transcript_64939/m.209131 type:complete len:297 (-) Transcript_64939:1190-2080(-)